jgi:hypothetical protein
MNVVVFLQKYKKVALLQNFTVYGYPVIVLITEDNQQIPNKYVNDIRAIQPGKKTFL